MIGERPDGVNGPSSRPLWKDRHGFEAKDIWCCTAVFAMLATVVHPDMKGAVMFQELNEELLDLSAGVRGVGNAVYAASQDDPGSCALCCSFVLCCCCELCW
jgi:hypothetical protein